MKKHKFEIFYAEEVFDHLKAIDKKYWSLIRQKIEEQLFNEPDIESQNRKPLSKPPIDDRWELRFGPQNSFRVFYKINYITYEVLVLAIGVKLKEKLYIGNKEIKL
jgi:mRNA-degrading endonuclease RelE of RelBE toxin-antitoxin system